MHRFLLHNGQILDSSTRDLSPGQVGLLNGWGVFSTIRVYGGVMFAWERHYQRMRNDAARLRVPFPADSAELAGDLYRLIEANGNPDTVVRVTIIRNRGGLWQGPVAPREFDVIAYTRDVTRWSPEVKLALVPDARHAASPFAGAKYLSWSENLTLYETAHDQGYDDALLLNERGEVAECTSANIFAVEGDRVWTPPLSSGGLPGVTRAILLEEIRVPGVAIEEKVLFPADLESADEVFITSSTRELLPVVSVQSLKVRPVHMMRDRLQAAFSKYREEYLRNHPSIPRVTQSSAL